MQHQTQGTTPMGVLMLSKYLHLTIVLFSVMLLCYAVFVPFHCTCAVRQVLSGYIVVHS